MLNVFGLAIPFLSAAAATSASTAASCPGREQLVVTAINLDISKCRGPVEPGFDLLDRFDKQRECQLSDGSVVRGRRVQGDTLNDVVTIESKTRGTLALEPARAAPRTGAVAAPTIIACSGQRVFVANPVVGTVSAYRPDGRRLWTVELPDFSAVAFDADSLGSSAAALAALHEEKSITQQLIVAGEYVLAEYRTSERGFYHVAIHRSGQVVGRAGPWQGVLTGGSESNAAWSGVLGDSTDIRYFRPLSPTRIAVKDDEYAQRVRHFLAWFNPRPSRATFEVECGSRPDDELKYWLGSSYNAGYAGDTRRAYASVLEATIRSYFDYPTLRETIDSYRAGDSEWVDRFQRALTEAGVDTALSPH